MGEWCCVVITQHAVRFKARVSQVVNKNRCRPALVNANQYTQYAVGNLASQVLWWKSGLIPPIGTYQKGYWMDPFSLFWVEIILMQFAELKR